MKRFLLFGVTEFSDMSAGARGYLGQFETFEELINILNKNKDKIIEENMNGFNILDLEYEEILLDIEYDFWSLIDFNDNMNGYEIDNKEIHKLMKEIRKRINPINTYINQQICIE